jgi:hypothetical protein
MVAAVLGSLASFVVALRRAFPGDARQLRRENRELAARVEQLERWGTRGGLAVPAWPPAGRRHGRGHRDREAR